MHGRIRLHIETLECRNLLAGEHISAFSPPGHHIIESSDFLTAPRRGNPLDIAVDYLSVNATQFGLSPADFLDMQVTDITRSDQSGVTHLYFAQRLNGLPVHGTQSIVNVTSDGRIVNAFSNFVSNLPKGNEELLRPQLGANEALNTVSDHLELPVLIGPVSVEVLDAGASQRAILRHTGIPERAIVSELRYLPRSDGGVELAWQMDLVSSLDTAAVAFVSARTNELLGFEKGDAHFTDYTYNVFPVGVFNPLDGNPANTLEAINDPADDGAINTGVASPGGWHTLQFAHGANEFNSTQGNNISSFFECRFTPPQGNCVDGAGPLFVEVPGIDENDPIEFAFNNQNITQLNDGGNNDLSFSERKQAGVVNAFYVGNAIHDIMWHYGFNENSGNFQAVNQNGNVNTDGDHVRIRIRPNEGPAGPGANRLRAWDGAFCPGLDPELCAPWIVLPTFNNVVSSTVNNVILHEYGGHLLTTMLTGGPATVWGGSHWVMSREEGLGDWMGLMLSQSPGELPEDQIVLGQALGIAAPRNYVFNDANVTYQDFVQGGNTTHANGRILASTLWDLNWLLIHGNTPYDSNGQMVVLNQNMPPGYGFDANFLPQDNLNGDNGNNIALRLFVETLRDLPPTNSYLDFRDTMLAADRTLYGGRHELQIWQAFAQHGMGANADDAGGQIVDGFDLPDDVLFIVGGGANDSVDVSLLSGQILTSVNAGAVNLLPGNSVPVNVLDHIWIDLAGGADTVTTGNLAGSVIPSVPMWIWGRDGNDTLHAGSAVDFVQAGGGIDEIFGEGGNDWLWGGAGDDTVNGGGGTDFGWGGEGFDTRTSVEVWNTDGPNGF